MARQVIRMIAQFADRLNGFVGASVAWLTLLMVVVTCGVVLARYVFDFGSIALQESVIFMHGSVFMLGVAYTLKEKGHVRVDVLYERFSQKTKALIDLIGHLIFLVPFSLFILWTSLGYVEFAWSLKESSAQPGGLPGVYLFKTLIPIMAALLLIQGISEILKALLRLAGETTE